MFKAATEVTGLGVRRHVPDKYMEDLQEADLFNASMAWDLDQVAGWQSRHGVEMEGEPSDTFRRYLETDHVIFMSLVEHPQVVNPERFVACSVLLQRAVIFFGNGKEDLFLRSYFHSATDDGQEFVNFVPASGLHISFATEALWYPLELSQFIQAPASYITLDILTSKRLHADQLPKSLRLEKRGRMIHGLQRFQLARVTGMVEAGQEVSDLRLDVRG
jgi:hypothetical protein